MYRDVVQWTRIRRRVLTGGASQRQIASETGIARATVRKMVQFSVPPGCRRGKPFQKPKLGTFLEVIDRIVEEDASQPTKQRRSAKSIWEWLKEKRGFNGGLTIVRNYVREERRRVDARSTNQRSHISSPIPSDPSSKSQDPAWITYLIIQSVPKREAIRLLRVLLGGAPTHFDWKIFDPILARFAIKDTRAAKALRQRQAAFDWMRKVVQGESTRDKLAEEIGEPSDLEELLHAITESRLSVRNRALAILARHHGISSRTVCGFLHISRQSVLKYCRSYRRAGWKSMIASKRKGSAKFDKGSNKQAVFSLLHSPPSAHGFNRTTWRMVDLWDVLRKQGQPMSKDVIHTIIKQAGYKWRRARIVLTSRDPEYRTKVNAIHKILSELGQREAFFSIDEYGPFAVKQKGGIKRVAPGENYVVPQWQKSKGWMILTAALELSRNQVTHFYSWQKNTDEMIKMVDILRAQYASCSTIYLSWDAASWHISKKLGAHLEKLNLQATRDGCPVVKTAPLPAGAQFLNVIESVFSGMAKAIMHNSDYPSAEAARHAIDRYFAERNAHFSLHPKRAGNKIWGRERVPSEFQEGQNCKDPLYR
jgi:transposase